MRSCDPKEIDMRPLVIKTRNDPHPLVWLSGIAIIVFCGTGIAAIMGWIPTSMGQGRDSGAATAAVVPAQAVQGQVVQATGAALRAAASVPAQTAVRGAARASCAGCGVIEATRQVDRRAESVALPAIGAMSAGNDIERQAKSSRSYELSIRMDDGSLRLIHQARRPDLRAGDHVRIVDGAVVLDMGG